MQVKERVSEIRDEQTELAVKKAEATIEYAVRSPLTVTILKLYSQRSGCR